MKRNNLTYLLPTAMLSISGIACVETYPGLTEDMSGTDIVDSIGMNDTVMAHEEFKLISVAISDPSYNTAIGDTTGSRTRAFGAFDKSRPDSLQRIVWDSARFIILALQDSPDIDFTVTRQNDSVACLLDNEPTWMADPNGYVLSYVIDEKHDGHNWWNNGLPHAPYRFWGYYLDDAKIHGISRNKDHIGIELDIDGSQDILSGHASLTDIQKEKIAESDTLQMCYGQYMMQERQWECLYSTTTARHDIIPIISMRHKLARFSFEVYPGNAASDSIVIDSLKVFSSIRCELIVASNDNDQLGCVFKDEPKQWLNLHEKDNKPTLDSGVYVNRWKEEYETTRLYERDRLKLGEGMMLPPTDLLRIQLFAHQRIKVEKIVNGMVQEYDTVVNPFEHLNGGNVVNLAYAKGFKPGNIYTIRIALYGDKPIEADAELAGWDPQDPVISNPEDEEFRPY